MRCCSYPLYSATGGVSKRPRHPFLHNFSRTFGPFAWESTTSPVLSRSQRHKAAHAPSAEGPTKSDMRREQSSVEDVEQSVEQAAPDRPEAELRGDAPELFSTLSLFLVAVLWGTNPVCLRYIYLLKQPPGPAALAAIQSAGAALLLSGISATSRMWQKTAGNRPPLLHPEREGLLSKIPWPKGKDGQKAGAEVGVWTFLANAATISAFQQTTASRGAFLLRLTAVFTPAASWLSGSAVSSREWVACCIALLGGTLISLEGALNSDPSSTNLSLGAGDALMILSALLWSVQTVRLGVHAKRVEPLALARDQTITLASLSGLWLAASFALARNAAGSSPVGDLFTRDVSLVTWLAVLWPAIGPWGIATALQVRAQGVVTPSKTQIILATDPIWATLFAGILGGNEQNLGSLGWTGAGCLLLASITSKH